MTDCQSCRFWAEGFDPDFGDCRRHAPRIILGHFQTVEDGFVPERDAIWPQTAPDHWCGEGLPRDNPPPAEGRHGEGETLGCACVSAVPAPAQSTPHQGDTPKPSAESPEPPSTDMESSGGAFPAGAERGHNPNPCRCLQQQPTAHGGPETPGFPLNSCQSESEA